MKISIKKYEVEKVRFGTLGPGDLFSGFEGGSELYIKTVDDYAVGLLDGTVEDGITPDCMIIDDSDKYILADA